MLKTVKRKMEERENEEKEQPILEEGGQYII
jgi:hypothetical protein